MADKNYLKQPQADDSAAEAAKRVVTVDVTVAGSDYAGPYYPGNAKCIILIATAAGVKFQLKAGSIYRHLIMTGEHQTGNNVKAGIINGGAIPHEFYLLDTSGSDNACTMYWMY